MVKFSKEERDFLHKVHLLSGKSYENTKAVFEGMLYLYILSFLEKEPIMIPFLGEFNIKYIKDVLSAEGRDSEVQVDFEPNVFLRRVIGQIEDQEETDVEKMLKERIHDLFNDMLK